MEFRFVEVRDQALLDRVLRFRYEVWCVEKPILDSECYPDGREKDNYDDYADHFAVLDENDEVCATVRLIHHSPLGYPTANYLEFDNTLYSTNVNKVAELSRIFIAPKNRNMKETKVIIQGLIRQQIYFKLREYGIDFTYGALEKGFQKLLKIFKVPYTILGDAKEYYGGQRHPCIMNTIDLEKNNPDLPELYKAHHV